jgi:beta-lactamase superfamily II metal-dependent hydrolase
MRYLFAAFCLVAFGVTPSWGKEPKVPGLNIYFVDTEGGAATLIVTPHGESVLIDCGNPGKRDAERICAATQLSGLKAIDHLIISHWHLDHYGAVEHLIKQIPIHHFYDHGIPEELKEDPKNFKVLIEAYKKASKDKSHTLKAGDEVPLKQAKGDLPLRLFCLCGSGEVIADKPGAPENPLAKEHKAKDEDKTDNARSLGFLLSFGDFRLLNLGDLTWNIEHKLVHPSDKVGLVDVYQVTHHGLDISNNPVLIKTVQPRVAIFCNGPKKGGHPSVTATLRRIDGIEAIYQMHKNLVAETHENTEAAYIANTEDSDKCKGELIKLTVAPDGKSYQVMVGANGKPKEFQTRLASRERK